jgi:hypothetical protein
MNEKNGQHEDKPPSLGNTLFLSGLCIVMGGAVFLIGVGVIPGGSADPSASARLLAIGAGLLFIFAGFIVLVRDFGGAKDGQNIPANAPLLYRLGEQVLIIVLVAIFAMTSSVIAFGPFFAGGALPDLTRQMGSFGAFIFRTINGIFALIFWYIAIYLALAKVRKKNSKPSPIDPGI